ncbi:hypothetical protein C6P40_002536 [Pichia californica]|uniref:P-loop containing nucleoside triphosphate hydrolase protein n=1 Tax=Pichia californica TaxID=460514 RepID=A0A9P6WHI9_9ASCO|nr:hypothetical protein C6P40_002536 [[Candida] californica]
MSDSQLEKQVPKELEMQKRWFTFLFTKSIPPVPTDEERKIFPERKSNPLSQFMFLWMNPILITGYKRTLQYEDTWKLDHNQQVDTLYNKFISNLTKLKLKNGNNKVTSLMLLKSLHNTLLFDIWFSLLFKALADIASSTSPLLLKRLTNFVENTSNIENVHYGKGAGYAVGCALLIFFNGVSLNYSFYRAAVLGSKVRVILTRTLMEKSFTVNSNGFHKFPSSRINSIMSTDLSRVDMGVMLTIIVVFIIIPIAISVALLIVNIGVSALAGLATFVLMFVILGLSFKTLVKLREKASKFTDIRVNLTKEFLKNFKMIKLYSWENSYNQRIEDSRNNEIKLTLNMQTIKNILMSIAVALPNFSSMVAFLTVSKVSPSRSSGDIFASLTLFQGIAVAFFNLPLAIGGAANVKVAFERVSEFLSCDDFDVEEYKLKTIDDKNIAIKVENADFEWKSFDNDNDEEEKDDHKVKKEVFIQTENKDSTSLSSDNIESTSVKSLKNINFEISKGEFIIVTGSIGSGKSSLLYALSGLMERTNGEIYVNYNHIICGNSWIKNDTIRDNIIFGSLYDEKKYKSIIDACCLNQDFKQFSGGDLTEVGERGVTLSGGQKARICLARSIYADKDILYLDDVLSAVDAKVGKHIVNECICGLLKGKTVILATHHIDLANKADRIIFMNGDGTLEIGKINELKSEFPKINDFFSSKAIVEITKNENINSIPTVEEENNKEVDILNDSKIIRIIGDEEKAVNNISFDVYKTFHNLGAGILGPFFLPLLLTLIIFSTFSTYFSNVWLSYWIEDHFKNKSYGFYVGLYVFYNIMYAIFSAIEFIILGYFCVTASKKLNLRAIKKVLHAPVAFMDVSPLGRVLNRFTKDTDVLDNEIIDQVRTAIYPLSMMVGTIILCIIYLPWFAIAVPILLFLYIFLTCYYQASSRELKRVEAIRRSFVFTHFNESLEGLDTIKAYNRKEDFINILNKLMDDNNEVYFLTWAIQRWLGSGFSIITILFILIIALLCCFRVFSINAASTGLLLSYAISIPSYLSLSVRCLAQIETEFNSVERLNFYSKELVQEAAYEKPEIDSKLINWPYNGNIEFKNVNLKYRPELPYVIKNLNLTIKGNEKVGFCGRTGAGKSTFMTCLYRLTEFEGLIKIDNENIQNIGLHKLRSSMTIIPQDPVLFYGNIRSNLDPFNEYDDDQLWDSLVISGLIEKDLLDSVKIQKKNDRDYHKFHLDRDVEDNGSNFSLGERQLIALARALVKKTKILILDEATSSVDYITDNKIQETISTHFKDCTILSIAHRLKTILSFDRIVVMDNGEIIQFDEPKKLYEDVNGMFRTLCEQSGIDESDFA